MSLPGILNLVSGIGYIQAGTFAVMYQYLIREFFLPAAQTLKTAYLGSCPYDKRNKSC